MVGCTNSGSRRCDRLYTKEKKGKVAKLKAKRVKQLFKV